MRGSTERAPRAWIASADRSIEAHCGIGAMSKMKKQSDPVLLELKNKEYPPRVVLSTELDLDRIQPVSSHVV
jgi:hypothetical protein